MSLQHLQPLACWAQDHSNEVLLLKNRHRPVCMSRTVARRILRKWQRREDVGDIKEFQSHLSILKIALGVRPHTELETSVKRFFDGPLHIDDAAKNVAPPAAVAEVLRPYQIKGFQWLLNNAQNGFGSLLADDMGLGKTLQTISLMIYLEAESDVSETHLGRGPTESFTNLAPRAASLGQRPSQRPCLPWPPAPPP